VVDVWTLYIQLFCKFQESCLVRICPLDQIIVHGECIELTSEGVVYRANLLIAFNKELSSHSIALLYDGLVAINYHISQFCRICSIALYELNSRPTTTVVFRTEAVTGKRCGEDVILSHLKRIESLTFRIESVDAYYTATVIDLPTNELGPSVRTSASTACMKESMEKYTTISSHYFCKAVLVDRERALLIGTKNVTYKDSLRPFTYVCEDEIQLFTKAMEPNITSSYMPCCAYVYLYLLIVSLWALVINVTHC